MIGVLALSLMGAASTWDGPCAFCGDADGKRLQGAWASSATTDEQKQKLHELVDTNTHDGKVSWHDAAEQYFLWRNGGSQKIYNSSSKASVPQPQFNDSTAIRVAEEAVLSRLIDPSSSQFSWRGAFFSGTWKPFLAKRVAGYIACGDVNARNRLGGYTGGSAFVVVLTATYDVTFLDMDDKGMGLVDISCAKSGYSRTNQWESPQSQQQQPAPSQSSLADELGKLAALRDKGILTSAEFDTQKAKLLSR